jgi:hypothetical protein
MLVTPRQRMLATLGGKPLRECQERVDKRRVLNNPRENGTCPRNPARARWTRRLGSTLGQKCRPRCPRRIPAGGASLRAEDGGQLLPLSHRRRFVTELIWSSGCTRRGHHSRYHRFFSKSAWLFDTLCRVLAQRLVRVFVPTGLIELAVDDTLCRKRGLTVYRVLPASVYESFRGVWYRWLSTQNPVEGGRWVPKGCTIVRPGWRGCDGGSRSGGDGGRCGRASRSGCGPRR